MCKVFQSLNISHTSDICNMKSSPELFSLEFSSSDQEFEERKSRVDIADLPSLNTPSPFQSDSSGCETPTSPASYVFSRPETPTTSTTPLSSRSSHGGEFSYINISSHTSDGASGSSKTPRRKKYLKRRSYPFKKEQPRQQAFNIVESTHSKKQKVECPKTPMFSDLHFPNPVGSYQIRIDSGDASSTQDLTIPTGNNICSMEILSLVFAQLKCTDRSCDGRLKLYERLIHDGLQRFLLLKCIHCHNVVADFPTSLPVGVTALDAINNKTIRSRGKSEINQRALMVVHTTSASWEDFRQCAAYSTSNLQTRPCPGHSSINLLELLSQLRRGP